MVDRVAHFFHAGDSLQFALIVIGDTIPSADGSHNRFADMQTVTGRDIVTVNVALLSVVT